MIQIADPGTVLCHYTSSAVAFEEILPRRQLRFSPYGRMRDPTEFKPWTFTAAFFSEVFTNEAEEADTYRLAHEALNEKKYQTKLLALTKDAEEAFDSGLKETLFSRAWARARMWEQYGEDHRGTCLVFDRDRLRQELSDDLQAADISWSLDGEVSYTVAGLAGKSGQVGIHLDQFKLNPWDQAVSNFLRAHADDLFLLKTLDWNSEHEYRFLAQRPDDNYLMATFEKALVAVVVGAEFPDWQVAGAQKLCSSLNTKLFRLKWLIEGPYAEDLSTEPMPDLDFVERETTD